MKQKLTTQTYLVLHLIIFGVAVFLVHSFGLPYLGMVASSLITGILMTLLLFAYLMLSSRETDERERMLQLQSDSAALYIVIAGLFAASVFYPDTEFGMAFWGVVALAVVGRIVSFLYQKYK